LQNTNRMTKPFKKGDLVYVPSAVSLQKWPWSGPTKEQRSLGHVPIPVKIYTTTKPSHCLVVESHFDTAQSWIAVYHEGATWWAKTNDVYEAKNEAS